jgi:hypothetical protein
MPGIGFPLCSVNPLDLIISNMALGYLVLIKVMVISSNVSIFPAADALAFG